MKILYGASNLNGSNIRLSHFLHHTNHDVRVAAYYKNHNYLKNIHWNLEALHNQTSKSSEVYDLLNVRIKLNIKYLTMMLDDISEWLPDLIITDFEPITVYIANILNIPFISITPLNLLNGTNLKIPFKSKFNEELLQLKLFETAKCKYITSPFGLLDKNIEIKSGYQWVKPYDIEYIKNEKYNNIINTLLNNNLLFSTGESEDLFNSLKLLQPICVADSQLDSEAKLNAIFVELLGLGVSIGDASVNYTLKQIDSLINNNFEYKIINDYKYLHEII